MGHMPHQSKLNWNIAQVLFTFFRFGNKLLFSYYHVCNHCRMLSHLLEVWACFSSNINPIWACCKIYWTYKWPISLPGIVDTGVTKNGKKRTQSVTNWSPKIILFAFLFPLDRVCSENSNNSFDDIRFTLISTNKDKRNVETSWPFTRVTRTTTVVWSYAPF